MLYAITGTTYTYLVIILHVQIYCYLRGDLGNLAKLHKGAFPLLPSFSVLPAEASFAPLLCQDPPDQRGLAREAKAAKEDTNHYYYGATSHLRNMRKNIKLAHLRNREQCISPKKKMYMSYVQK